MRNQADFLRLISDSSSGRVELGAHQGETGRGVTLLQAKPFTHPIFCQVIIVRNEKAAADLKAAIGRVGVVL